LSPRSIGSSRAKLQAEAQSLVERAERSVTGERLATVFVQYGNSVAPDVAQAVAEALKGQGYVVPGGPRGC
jgi:triosephosphate isomerase